MGKSGSPLAARLCLTPAVGCALNYGAVFLMLGIELPYLPVWLDRRGFSSLEIGLIAGAPLWLRIVAGPFIGMTADRLTAHRSVVFALALTAAIAAVLLSAASGLALVMTLVALMLVASHSTLPLVDMLAMETSRRDGRDYGRMRLWGSLTFIAANLAGGWAITRAGGEAVIWLIAATASLAAAAALSLPGRDARASTDRPAAGGTSARGLLDGGAVRTLLADRRFLLLVAAAGTVQASHAVYYGFSVIAGQRLGWSSTWIGALWSVGVAAEIVLFAMSGRVIAAVGAGRLMMIGAAGGVVRWTAMAVEPGLWPTVVLQSMHALSFGATYLATVHIIHAIAPKGLGATAQALNAAIGSGLGMALALIVAGLAFRAHGASAYLAMAGLAAVGLVAAVLLVRRWRPQPS